MPEPAVTIVVVPRERFSYSQTSLESLYANTHLPFRLIYVDGGSPGPIKRYLKIQAAERGIPADPHGALSLAQPGAQYRSAPGGYQVRPVPRQRRGSRPRLASGAAQCAEETNASLVGPLYCIGQPVHQVIHMAGGEACIREAEGRRTLYEKHRFWNERVSDVRPQMRRESCELVEFHCLLARAEVLRRLGPLDEALFSTREHLDLCFTVRQAGGIGMV